jgi:hypothetical protein
VRAPLTTRDAESVGVDELISTLVAKAKTPVRSFDEP